MISDFQSQYMGSSDLNNQNNNNEKPDLIPKVVNIN